MPFEARTLEIKDVLIIKPTVFKDERGQFLETFKRSSLLELGIDISVVQSNESRSARGVVRGLHYQLLPHAQGKLVHVISGSIFDVAVDIRKHSETFGKYVYAILSGDNAEMLWIPEGFAHGFQALEDDTVVEYKVTREYHRASEGGILWNDPSIGIKWPLKDARLSAKDALLPTLDNAENNF